MVRILGFWLGHISHSTIRKSIQKGLASAPCSTIDLTHFGAIISYDANMSPVRSNSNQTADV